MKMTIYIALILSMALLICLFAAESHDLELAQRFLVLEKYDKAAEILERFYAQNPKNETVTRMLKDAYTGMKAYDRLEAIIRSMLLQNPSDSELLTELGNTLLAQNKPAEAWVAFDRAIEMNPHSEALMIKIHNTLSLWGYIDKDIEYIRKARKRLNNDALLAAELARIYEIKGRYDDAVAEYALYLKKYPDRFSEVERKIDVGERTDEELKQLGNALKKLFDTPIPKWQAWRLLSIIEQKLGNYEGALSALEKAEEAQDEKIRGRLMSNFVEDMLRRGEYEPARKGASFLILKTAQNYSLTGRFYLARALQGLGLFQQAIEQLDSIVDGKAHQLALDAIVLKARIYFDNLHDISAAEDALSKISTERLANMESAVVLKGEMMLRKREFEDAKKFLLSMAQKNQKSEKIAYLLAMTFFFSGSYDTARTVFHGVVSNFPKSSEANELVELLLVMQIAPEGVEKITKPLFLMYERDTFSALQEWQSLVNDGVLSQIHDYILWKLAMCKGFISDSAAAGTFLEIVSRFSGSFYAPLALEKLGDMEIRKGNTSAALQNFVRIINEYPQAVNIERVREKLRSIGGTF